MSEHSFCSTTPCQPRRQNAVYTRCPIGCGALAFVAGHMDPGFWLIEHVRDLHPWLVRDDQELTRRRLDAKFNIAGRN